MICLTVFNHNNNNHSKNKPDLIQEIEGFEPKELIEIVTDNLENDIKVLNNSFNTRFHLNRFDFS